MPESECSFSPVTGMLFLAQNDLIEIFDPRFTDTVIGQHFIYNSLKTGNNFCQILEIPFRQAITFLVLRLGNFFPTLFAFVLVYLHVFSEAAAVT